MSQAIGRRKKTFTYANAVKKYTINKDTNDKTMENLFLLGFMFTLQKRNKKK